MKSDKPKVLLAILDGWGIGKDYPGNAISLAKTPFYDSLLEKYPHTQLDASGEEIGLPKGQMGTSEVNHFAIGAGKVVSQDLVRINQAIEDESFYQNPAFLKTFEHVKECDSALHVWGLVSDGGVHSLQTHVVAVVEAAKRAGLNKVYVHAVTDGRDTSPVSGVSFVEKLDASLVEIGLGQIVTVVGRYYAMDRDKNMDRTDQAFELYMNGQGEKFNSASSAIQASYDVEVTDEFIKPVVVGDEAQVVAENDGLIMVNFRNDRPRQIAQLFLGKGPQNLFITTMTTYQPDFQVEIAYPLVGVKECLGKVISDAGLSQLRITETEKFAHLTFFLNCKKEAPFENEDRFMFDSNSDVPTHDLKPEMRALDIARKIVEDIESDSHEVIFTNLCNADMVGHTGNITATIKACEVIDQALAKIVPAALEHGYVVMITADHGNAEVMLTESQEMVTAHSCNQVPFILISDHYQNLTKEGGALVDMAPTILKILGLETPQEMTGQSFV
ncbi:MAG: 2,3-bisphosphoglycerate-independent phosphoglycerate mutase [Candidatus Pacebacteria bacterium]|nr:2,3-bisphosphoglycerate-independent phosphoglycerate mutase [Candidatus Paceibacterota bacterium]